MSIDLEAFEQATVAVHDQIQRLPNSFLRDTLQWMLAQIDDLTKKVAVLEAKCEEQDRFSAMRPIG